MREFHIGQTVVPYEVEWSPNRETISLSMEKEMQLRVRAPTSSTLEEVESVLEDKKQWVLETLYGLAEQQDPPLDKEFLSGEKLLYDGRRYRLNIVDAAVSEPELEFDGHQFDLLVPEKGEVSIQRKRQTVVDWYVERAKRDLPDRARHFVEKVGASEVEIRVSELRRRWGEYERGKVTLHWRLILAPRRIQDYVIAHELAHHKHNDHSDAFWNTVGTLVPDYRDRREWLRVNGATLRV